jgi:predicted enzyme related to lactoylglutathione lyase
MSDHPIVHIEFSAADREAAGKFYADLFGWKIQHMPEFNYTTFDTEAGIGGGINTTTEEYPAGTVVFYVGTQDIEASLAKAESLGGKTILPKMEVPGMGWLAMFLDPFGNKIGLWKEAAQKGN